MNAVKRNPKHNVLLWIGLGMMGAAFMLALVGFFYGSQVGSYAALPSNAGPQNSGSETTSNAGSSNNTGSSGVPRSLSEARDAFERAVSNISDSNLEVKDVMEFANNYYAEVKESDTGIYAMELLIDKRSGRVYPEPGPNMMWNTKYGMMSGRGSMGPGSNGMMGPNGGMMGPGGSGMMGGSYQPSQASPDGQMPISPEQATQIAEDYLNRTSSGTETEKPDQFYGYYTLHAERDGEVTGMLGVNGYTGQVWYHTWHGPFVAMEEEDEGSS